MKLTKNHLIKLLPVVALFIFCLLAHMALGYRLKIAYVFVIFFTFLLLNKVTVVYRPLLIVLGIATLVYAPIGLTYGSPNFNSILSLFYTNEQEASEFISSIPVEYYLFSAFILIFCLFSLKVNINLHRNISIFLFSFALITVIHHSLKAFVQGTDTKRMRFAHNDKYKQNHQVPMFILSYDDMSRNIIDVQHNFMSFLTLFSGWTGIKESKIPENYKMFSNEICENQDYVLNFSNKVCIGFNF
ncbi:MULTISPECIES: hypothetical protein [Photorhabdus]|uniref:Sulfatase N-terminal domain-containing protein n=1 Tax=Photorhabdus laumondii subsp. clarkei TaxID=2029685 RepID=A0A329VDH7_9GAMM|nr:MULTISPECIES: hypothetical protein [Photorhabdus]MCT8350347.1 hypothetical protein [Photorhabdus kayaii]RAW90306.1 hypothetical protein CKY01_14060 [Photorhabdus laumondii subsp. clarkei]